MSDLMPDTSNRFATAVGRILHPFLLPIPTTLAILSDLPFGEALLWSAMVLGMIVLPVALLTAHSERTNRPIYKRMVRSRLYAIGWGLILLCLLVLLILNAPRVVIACVGALAVWIPLQWTINRYVTKISAHAAVAVGCFTGLLMLGKLANPVILIVLTVLVILTLWARVVTRNHTLTQVILGVLVGALPVLVVFPVIAPIP